MAVKLDTKQELAAFAEEIQTRAAEIESKLMATEEDAKTTKQQLAEMATFKAAMDERLKSIQQLIKAPRGAETEDNEEGRLYRLGAMVNALMRAHRGSAKEKREAAILMSRIKAFPTTTIPDEKGRATFSVRPEYQAKLSAALRTKTALSSDPLTSDDSDDSDFYGSYLVPVDTAAEIGRIALASSAMMGRVRHMPVRGITTYLPRTVDELAFTMVTDQETAKTEDTLTMQRATLTVQTYAFWLALTEEMDEDSLVSIGALVRDMGAEAWAKKFDTLALSDATYGAIATTGCNNLAMDAGDDTFDSISVAYMSKMPNQLTTLPKRLGGEYFLHPTVWDTVENERNDNGDFMLRQPADGAPYRIRGYNVVLTDGMPSTSAISTAFAAFGNAKYIVAGDKVGFEFRIYNQTESSMKYDQIFLRCRVRQAMVCLMPSAWVKLTTAAA